jgi:hypothetical protein
MRHSPSIFSTYKTKQNNNNNNNINLGQKIGLQLPCKLQGVPELNQDLQHHLQHDMLATKFDNEKTTHTHTHTPAKNLQ